MSSLEIAVLASLSAQLEKYCFAIPEDYRRRLPSPWDGVSSEKLNALEQICRVKDIEVDGYHVRLQHLSGLQWLFGRVVSRG